MDRFYSGRRRDAIGTYGGAEADCGINLNSSDNSGAISIRSSVCGGILSVLESQLSVELIDLDWSFFRSASLAASSQIFATVFLVKALTLRNFAVGTALAKTEAILIAIIGAWFFSATLSFVAYLAVAVGVLGVLVASNWKITLQDLADNKSIKYGIAQESASLWLHYG